VADPSADTRSTTPAGAVGADPLSTSLNAPVTSPGSGLAPVMERNINALLSRRQEAARQRRPQDKLADAVTRFTGSLTFVLLHVVIVAGWVAVNTGLLPVRRFDPSFVILATVASVEAIFLSTFVLISQNRMQAEADARADLDLQISLLAEHEVTRVVSLVSSIAERMGIAEASDPALDELKRDVAPERVLDQIEHNQQALENESSS
jgi:uncharacterized membrane protein